MIGKYGTIIGIVIGAAAGSGATLYISKAVKPNVIVKTEKVVAPQCPPCQGIDFDKIKSKYITIENQQYLTIQGDSTLKEAIRQIIKDELSAAKVVKCRGK
jgi:hypothetical protein